MDSDDISDKSRLMKQLNIIVKNKADVVGSNLTEFVKHSKDLRLERRVPKEHEKIKKLSKWRNPMNGASLMFRKKDYIQIGGYPHNAPFFEDVRKLTNALMEFFEC